MTDHNFEKLSDERVIRPGDQERLLREKIEHEVDMSTPMSNKDWRPKVGDRVLAECKIIRIYGHLNGKERLCDCQSEFGGGFTIEICDLRPVEGER